uniref:Deoxynucleotidyltransferase terminal-interacting protein 1 n=1 Tax=Branchiostoma floridae TaxID=7739 RepID=C3YCS8_BRAFL|eukprot:XP_002605869.1 hypothetical protein BRAFLDRAFT_90804 [Branchiostoma floridae]
MAEPRSPLGIYMAQQQYAASNAVMTPPSSDVNHSEGRPALKRQKSVTSPAVAPPGYVVIQPYDATYKNFPSKRKETSYHYRGRTISSPEGSMELLRKCMQKHINNTLVEAIKPYKELFEKGAQNCRDNCGEEVDPDRLVRTAIRHSLEQKAKRSLSSSDGGAPVNQVVRFKRAYLLIVDDVLELAETDEYRNNEGLQLELLVGFQVPPFMLEKMKVFMRMSRTDTLRESPAALKEKPDQEITTQEAN